MRPFNRDLLISRAYLSSPRNAVTEWSPSMVQALTFPAKAFDHRSAPQTSVWADVHIEATELACREPFFAKLPIFEILTRSSEGQTILTCAIVDRLEMVNAPIGGLRSLFQSVLDDNVEIITAAEADLRAVRRRDPACTTHLHALLNLKGYHALQAHRIANHLWNTDRCEIALWLSNIVSLVFGPDIHPAAKIGSAIMLDHASGIVIGETTVIEDNVSILQDVTLGGTGKEVGDRHPKVGEGVMIGAGAKILGNVQIGAFSKVAAGSVVLRPVPPYSTVAGVPAVVVRSQHSAESPAESMDQEV